MCFSASASFIASGGLAAVGGAALHIAKGRHQKLIAAIPLLFAIQQGLEGWQWIALNNGSMNMFAGYLFLFFALLFWPMYVPMSIFVLDKKQRDVLGIFVGIGIALALFFSVILIREPLVIQACNHSIVYLLHIPLNYAVTLLYYFTVCGALFFSSKREFHWFSVVVFLSAAIAAYFFLDAFISVSCFFEALLSSLIYFYLKYHRAHAHK